MYWACVHQGVGMHLEGHKDKESKVEFVEKKNIHFCVRILYIRQISVM